MLSPLLATKLYIPPAQSNRVPRPRLNEKLNISQPLTLIAAPAGFGKTTALSEWIPTSPHCVTWLSLDDSDNDPNRFWIYVIAALQTLRADLGAGSLSLLQLPQSPPIRSILTTLINEIASFPERFCLVIDDYHLIQAQIIHEALAFLLDHLPPNMRVILTTRADPSLPIARLRAHNQLIELRAGDLRFTSEEAAVFLNQMMGLKLSQGDIAVLESRTEGWIAGLQLAALSMQKRDDLTGFIRAFSGSNRFVLDYLAEEVLNRRTKDTLNFLLQTSILDRLNGSLCDAVTGQTSSHMILEELEHDNLFIVPLDEEHKWYRYHHLFAEVLHGRLKQVQPDPLPELFRRASEWFEQSGVSAEAIEYALQGRDWSRAIQLIEANMQGAQQRGEIATVLRWLAALPDEAMQTQPKLGLTHASLLVIVDGFAAAQQRLEVAEKALLSNPLPDAAEQSALLGQAALVRETNALMLEYSGEAILEAGQEALRLLPESDVARRGYAFTLMGCGYYLQLGDMRSAEEAFQEGLRLTRAAKDLFSQLQILTHLGQMRAVQGLLHAAEEACLELIQLGSAPGWEKIPAAGLGRVMYGRVLYERNELSAALDTLTAGVTELEGYTLKRAEIIGLILLARVRMTLGEVSTARQDLDRAWAMIQMGQLKQITAPAAAYRARLLLQMGDLKTAAQWASTIVPPADNLLNPALEYDYITWARVQLALDRCDEARELLARLLPPAKEAGRTARAIEILVLQARDAWLHKDVAKAFSAMDHALFLAQPEGFIRVFVDEGEAMRDLIAAFLSNKGNHPWRAYTERLFAAFGAPPTLTLVSSERSVHQNLVEPLSPRELEVLNLIADGASNQEIAQKLTLTLNTVKKHSSNLFAKLGVTSRTQAVARARERQLI